MQVYGGSGAADTAVSTTGLDVWLYSKPFGEDVAGGGVYYLSSCSPGRITRLALADVRGHGTQVAEIANRLLGLMQRHIDHIDQGRLVTSVNQEFVSVGDASTFATGIIATYFIPTGALTLTNAGHPAPLRYDFQTGEWRSIETPPVERTLATPEILESQVRQIADVQTRPPRAATTSRAARRLATRSAEAFADLVRSDGLLELLATSTPYTRLGALNIGNRPVKRAGTGQPGLESLRAIPWVLCWTQTRYLAHAWLGVGTAWQAVREAPGERARLLRACRRDPFLRSYLRQLRFTLAKTAPAIWSEYTRDAPPNVRSTLRRLEEERRDALDFAVQLTGGQLLEDRRWLSESIHYRAPMINPLNLMQVALLDRSRLNRTEELLFRETVTGIAAGMLTTG